MAERRNEADGRSHRREHPSYTHELRARMDALREVTSTEAREALALHPKVPQTLDK